MSKLAKDGRHSTFCSTRRCCKLFSGKAEATENKIAKHVEAVAFRTLQRSLARTCNLWATAETKPNCIDCYHQVMVAIVCILLPVEMTTGNQPWQLPGLSSSNWLSVLSLPACPSRSKIKETWLREQACTYEETSLLNHHKAKRDDWKILKVIM